MPISREKLEAVLDAARGLLGAREDGMLTDEQWVALDRAVAACDPHDPHHPHDAQPGGTEAFAVEDGRLIRKVVPARGNPYEHTCTIDSYEAVADAIDQFRGSPFTIGEIHERTGLPWTQVNVALAFLKDRGCIVPARNRRHKAAPGNAPDGVLIDAMIEYHALAEKGPADEAFGYETPGPEPAEG